MPEATMSQEPLVFSSEEEREKAFLSLPEEPPRGANIDKWFEEIEQKKAAIAEAKIVSKEDVAKGKAEAQPPANPPASQIAQPSPVTTPDEELDFGRIKRSELPEELRGYKSPGEIIKQFGHARNYANTLEKRYTDVATKLADLEQRASKVSDLEQEVLRLKQIRDSAQAAVQTAPMSTAQRSEMQQQVDDISSKITNLEGISQDDEFINAGILKKVMGNTAGEMNSLRKTLASIQSELTTYKQASEEKIGRLNSEVNVYAEETKRTKAQQEALRRQSAIVSEIKELQSKYPELRTTKPVMATNPSDPDEWGSTVEADIARFTNRVLMLKDGDVPPSNDWTKRNRVLNQYLRGEPELIAFCRANGVSPEAVGTTEQDLRAYATFLNVDAHMKGQEVDAFNGTRRQLLNPVTGQPVSYESYEAAYKRILDKTGVTQAELDRIRSDAEKRAVESLERSISKRDTSLPAPGPQHSVSAADAGQEISEIEALNIVKMPSIEEKIEFGARKGDRSWFNKYNLACRRIGWPEMEMDSSWPQEKRVQQ